MRKEIALLSALGILGFSGAARRTEQAAQQAAKPAAQAEKTAPAPAPFVIPADIAKAPDPVKPTAASIAAGKQMYGYDCAMCHGANGSGKGDLAAEMKLTLKDYREPASLKDITDGEMFYIIQKGKGDMTGEGDRQKPDGIWNMINYLRSLSKKTPAAKAKPAG
ncbi:MAG: c-type cytochrome [Candidatus Acidiferrales bacterium]